MIAQIPTAPPLPPRLSEVANIILDARPEIASVFGAQEIGQRFSAFLSRLEVMARKERLSAKEKGLVW